MKTYVVVKSLDVSYLSEVLLMGTHNIWAIALGYDTDMMRGYSGTIFHFSMKHI